MAERIERLPDAEIRVVEGGAAGREDPAAIRAEIRETRERMSHTLDGISARLNPHHLREQVKHNIREATIGRAEHMARNAADRMNETRYGIMDTIRDNPLPAAMVGIGLGWLFWNGRDRDSHAAYDASYRRTGGAGGYAYVPPTGYGAYAGSEQPREGVYDHQPGTFERASDWAGERGDRVRERTGEMAGRAQETMHEVADRTRETASQVTGRTQEMISQTTDRARSVARDLAHETRMRGHRVEDRFQSTLDESPLVLGAAAMALGLVAGLGAPTTRREAELMGGARDRLVDRARETMEETTDKMQSVAQRVADEARSTAQEAAREEGLVPGGSSGSESMSGAGAGRGMGMAAGERTTGDSQGMSAGSTQGTGMGMGTGTGTTPGMGSGTTQGMGNRSEGMGDTRR